MTKTHAAGVVNREQSDSRYDSVAGLVNDLLKTWHVPGVSVTIVDGDDAWVKGYGVAELPTTAFSADTLSYAGSTTKAHVVALLALLIDSGRYKGDDGNRLSWSTPISSLIRDDFVLQDEWATAHLTLEDAVCHRTGLSKHDNAYIRHVRPDGFCGPRRLITLREMVRNLRQLPMGSEPRTTFCYSNLLFATLSHVIETLTGQWLGDVLRTWLWKPLGMDDTYLSLDQALASGADVARGYFWDAETHEYTPFERMPTEEVTGSGAVITSAADLTKWIRFWLREKGPLTPAAHGTLRHPHIVVGSSHDPAPYDTPVMYAKGWQTSSYRGHRFWTHHGGMDAFGAQVTFFPGLDFGIAVMGNTAFTTNAVAEMSTWHIIDAKLGVPLTERFDWIKKWQSAVQQIGDNVRGGLDKIYPTRPTPAIAASLPIQKYAGLYYHPGYKYLDVTFSEIDGVRTAGVRPEAQLHARLPDNNFRIKCDFVHVSGEHWIMYVDLMDAPTLTMHDFGAVEFLIGVDGEIESMGIEWRARTAVEQRIWYKRVRPDTRDDGNT